MNKVNFYSVILVFVILIACLSGCTKKNIKNMDTEPAYEEPIGEGNFQLKNSIAPTQEEGDIQETNHGVRVGLIPPATPDSPLHIRFSEDIGIAGNKGNLSQLKDLSIEFYPSIKGVYEWKSKKELWIREDKKIWDTGKEFNVSISSNSIKPVYFYGDFTAGTFSLGPKTGSREVTLGKPGAVIILNGNTGLASRSGAYILFDQPVTPDQVTITCEKSNGEKVDIALSQPKELPIEGGDVIDPSYVLFAGFKMKLNPEENIMLSAGHKGDEDTANKFNLTIAPELTYDAPELDSFAKTGKTMRLKSTFEITFSNPVLLDTFRQCLDISPTPRGLYIYQQNNTFIMELTFEIGTEYKIGIGEGQLTDILGQRLSKNFAYQFKSQDLIPYLELPNKQLVLEVGQDRFPVKVRNPGKAKVLIQTFKSHLDYINALSGKNTNKYSSSKKLEVDLGSLPMNDLHVLDIGIDNKPGLKLITITIPGSGSEASSPLVSSLLVQTTGIGLSVKIWDQKVLGWTTDLNSGKSASNINLSAISLSGKILAEGITGAEGVATLNVGAIATSTGIEESFYLVAKKDNDTSIITLNNDELSQPWQFNVPGFIKDMIPFDAAVFTERGVYRPGDTVYFKLFARPMPELSKIKVSFLIRDPLGQKVFNYTQSLDDYYGASGSFDIKEGAAVGEYFLEVSTGSSTNKTTFRVEEYRVPTFTVKVKSSNKDFLIGNSVSIEAKADYLHGGLLDGRSLNWKVYRQPDVFSPKNFPGYVFGMARDNALTGTLSSGTDVLNNNSEFKFSYTPNHPDTAGLMKYIAEVSVTDVDRQTYAGRFSKSIHATGLYVGIKPQAQVIFSEGSVLKLPFVVVDTEGKILSGKNVEVQLNRIEYHTTTMENEEGNTQTYNREVIESKTLGFEKSSNAPKDLTVPLNSTGLWQVRLNVKDDKGKKASTEFIITVSGGETSSWPRFDKDRIELIADKGEYKTGDTAKIVAQTPYESATGLLTLEASGVISYRIVEINKNTPAFEIPITSDYAPNVYASLVLIRGRVHKLKDASGFETGAPGYKIGYAKLNIDPGEKRLKIGIDPGSGSASPGDNVTITISAKDIKGSPADASATVMVVDEGVLSLTGYKTPDPVALAYAFRSLGVRNSSNILDMPHSKRIRKESLFPGGDSDQPATLMDDGEALRKLFKSTAYWNPSLVLGKDGQERVTIKLPDNLTTFRIMVVASDQNGRMGSGESELISRKSLMIQPIIPRFIYPDDTFDLEAQVINGSGAAGDVSLDAEFKGLEIIKKPDLQVKLPSGKSYNFVYKVKVIAESIEIKFRAVMGPFKDGVEVKLPVLSPGNKVTMVKNALLGDNGEIDIQLPEKIISGTLKVEAVLSGTPLSQLKDSIQYLMEYPNGCIEQTTSTAYPLIVLQDLLPSIGIEVNRADLKKFSEAGVKRILSFQTSQGGLSYWPDGTTPHAFATAFGLTVLLEGKKRGYNVPSEALERMGDFLEKSLKEGTITGEMPHESMADGDTRALFVMTLGRLGRPQPGYIETLWNSRKNLTPFGLCFLAIAIKESKTQTALLEPILAEIKAAAEVNEKEAFYEGKPKGGWSMDSPIRTHAGALIAYSSASQDSELTPKLLQGLLSRGNNGMWGNTQENVFGIMGIYQLVTSQKESKGDIKASIVLNGKSYSINEMESNSSQILRLTVPGSALGNNKGLINAKLVGTNGRSYYLTIRASFEEPLSDKFKTPKSEGYEVKRIYETLDGRSLEGKTIPLGSLVRVRLLIKANATQHYVAINDKLPAGLEALNMALETTQTIDQENKLSPTALKTMAVISYHEIRDQMVNFYADELSQGDYEFIYIAKASTPGDFLRPSGRAEAMYQTDFFGTSGIDRIIIK